MGKVRHRPVTYPANRNGRSLLVVAGLMAKGITEIYGLEHIDRGYEQLIEKLTALGARVWREKMTEEEQETHAKSF